MKGEGSDMLKRVGARGQLTLGKKYSGRYFEVEERAYGELVLRPVRLLIKRVGNALFQKETDGRQPPACR